MDFEKIIAKIRAGKTWRFHGGIHPAEHKDESSEFPIERLEPASVYIVPVRQHSGDAGTIVVKTGDYVRKGDPLTRSSGRRDLPVSAPTSGTIAKIGLHTAPHQSGLEDLEITITPDGKNEWRERHPVEDFRTRTPEELLSVIHNAGIAGMGGAGFPADQKIAGAVGKTHILIINGSECEPYITCDDRLMRESAAEIIEGVRILQYILKPEVAIIAIEDNKPEAAKAIKDAVKEEDDIIVRILETRYPTGAARPLIRRLTGIEVGYTSRSTDFGIEMQNVATTYAIKRAVEDDEPLIERIVTVTGKNFGRKGNFIVPFGTPVRHILDKCKWHGEARNELILGGPMMGFTVPTPDVSVTKTINCVFSPDSTEVMSYDNPLECIRCGRCARVCPSRLLPFALVKAAKAGDSEAIQRERIRDCIECGSCAFVCPSRIPLVRYIRIAKAKIREESAEARKKQNTERLIAEKLSREEKIAAARKARIAALKETSAPKAAPTAAAAVMAATAAGNGSAGTSASASSAAGAARPKSAALAAALARAKAQKTKEAAQNEAAASNAAADAGAASGASQTAASADVTSVSAEAQGSAAGSAKSKALAAALARAKARKAAGNGTSSSEAQEQEPAAPAAKPEAGARSAAVAAALAKAKARKAAESGETPKADTHPDSQAGGTPKADPKKAAVAAALAKARARKAAAAGESSENRESAGAVSAESTSDSQADAGAEGEAKENSKSAKAPSADPKKAALAAALARAKARKQAESNAQPAAEAAPANPLKSAGEEDSAESAGSGTSSAKAPAADPRKAAVAAALARARARKKAIGEASSEDSGSQEKAAKSEEERAPSEENK